MRLRNLAVVLGSVAVLGAACVPPPEPAPRWAPTVRQWSATPGSPVGYPFSATSDTWWAVVEMSADYETATLHLHRRGGKRGAPAQEPSFSFELANGASEVAMDDHVVAVRTRTAVGNDIGTELYELEADTWAHAATVLRPADAGAGQGLGVTDTLAVTDDHVVIGEPGTDHPDEVIGQVAVVPIDRAGPGISWSPGDVTTLVPDTAWPSQARVGFGSHLSIVGTTLAVSADWDRVAIYEDPGSGWAPDGLLEGGNPFGDGTFGRAVSLDADGAPRLAVGSAGGWSFGVPQPGVVEVYERGPGGWTLSDTIGPRAGSALYGFSMGSQVALDGDRLAVGSHWVAVPRPDEAGGGTVTDLRIEVHDLAATPTFRNELSLLDALGGVAAMPTATTVGPLDLDLAGDHLVADAAVGFGPDPVRFAAVSFDLG